MSFKVWVGSVAIETETAADALELAQRAAGLEISAKRPGSKPFQISTNGVSRWSEKRVADFFKLIEGHQQKLIDTLLENNEGRTDEQLRRALGLDDGKALGGVMAGATKNAKKVGADPKDLFVKKHVVLNGKKQREYFLSDAFKTTASQVQR